MVVTPELSAVTRGVSDDRGSTVVEKHGTCNKQTELGWRLKTTHFMGGFTLGTCIILAL